MKKHSGRNFITRTALPAVLVFAFAAGGFCLDFEIKPVNVSEAADSATGPAAGQSHAEYARLKDRIRISLFFRGELADKIMDAGLQKRLLKLSGLQSRASVREALLGWIKKNPDEAANLYFYLSRSGSPGALPAEIKYSLHSWEITPRFLGLINALTAAAGNKKLADETLNLAAGRLFEGPQASPESPGVEPGRSRTGEAGFFSGCADYRLNRAGLEREMLKLRGWTDALREGFKTSGESLEASRNIEAPSPRRRLLDETLAAYGAFAANVCALRSRSALTREESAGLEKERNYLRSKLAALTLLELAARVNGAARGLGGEDAWLFEEAGVLSGSFEKAARNFEEGAAEPAEIARVLPEAGRACAGFCVRASAARSLLKLRARLDAAGFSCLYDYLSCWFLERFYPETAYARARGAMAGRASVLSRARRRLKLAGLEDTDGDLEGEISAFSGSLEIVEKASAANRRAQFFLWGIFFRPVELEFSFSDGKLSFKPVFTFFRIVA